MRNLKYIKAFSLSEMMVVLFVISVVTAAILPIITQRQRLSATSGVSTPAGEELWKYVESGTGTGSDIYFNNASNPGIAIGRNTMGSDTTRLIVNTTGTSESHIAFQSGGAPVGAIKMDTNRNVGLSSSPFLNSTGAYNNTAFGFNALLSNETGDDNTAFGARALQTNVSASNNTAFGYMALASNTTGRDNTAFGFLALAQNTTGEFNTAVGSYALSSNTVGNNNTATGYGALTSNIDGNDNTAIGYKALFANVSGSGNTAVGAFACSNVTGSNNTCFGANSNVAAGVNNGTAIGYNARVTGDYGTAIGYDAEAPANTVMLGSTVEKPTLVAEGGVFIGSLETGGVREIGYNALSDIVNISDKRLKNVDGIFIGGLDQIRLLEIYRFIFKSDKNKQQRVGILAQDLQKIFPKAVIKGEKGYLMTRDEDIFYSMINSIKQLDKILKKLVDNSNSIVKNFQKIDKKIVNLFDINQYKSKKIDKIRAQNKLLEARLAKLEKIKYSK